MYDPVVDLVAYEGGPSPLLEREVYPNAPLRLVTAEYRFPLSPVLSGSELLTLLANSLGSALPIIEPAQSIQLTLGTDFGPPSVTNGYRLLTRDRTTAVTVTSSRVAIETTAYRHWEDFRDEYIQVALSVLGDDLGALAGLSRVGLRYINEIRIDPTPRAADEWFSYVNPDLLAPARIAGQARLKTVQIALHLEMDNQAELLMRTGILEGHVVDDTGPLRLLSPPQNGPFFLIDMDSFWTASGSLNEWNTSDAVETTDRLHQPIDDLFESCITEVLRENVLRRDR